MGPVSCETSKTPRHVAQGVRLVVGHDPIVSQPEPVSGTHMSNAGQLDRSHIGSGGDAATEHLISVVGHDALTGGDTSLWLGPSQEDLT